MTVLVAILISPMVLFHAVVSFLHYMSSVHPGVIKHRTLASSEHHGPAPRRGVYCSTIILSNMTIGKVHGKPHYHLKGELNHTIERSLLGGE